MKKKKQPLLLVINTDGKISTIYSDSLEDLFKEGETSIKRASHVEPNILGPGWVSDLNPSGRNVLLGPFRLRQEALDAEADFLRKKVLLVNL